MAIIYKKKLINTSLFTAILLYFICLSCEKTENGRIAFVTTDTVVISDFNITAKATIIEIGSKPIIDHGFCWSENKAPSINENVISLGRINENKSFSASLKNITYGKTYYYRAFLNDGKSITYGQVKLLIFDSINILIITGKPFIINDSSVSCTCKITVGSLTIKDFGHCWDTIPNPDINDQRKSLGFLNKDTVFTNYFTIKREKRYYIRAYICLDSSKVVYGSEEDINISEIFIKSNSLTQKSCTSAIAYSSITNLPSFQIIQHGHCWSTKPDPTLNDNKTQLGPKNSLGSYSSNLSNLKFDSLYYVRPYISDGVNIKYGSALKIIIHPTPEPIPTSNSPVCLDGTLLLDATLIPGASYFWIGPNGFSSTIKNPKISNIKNTGSGFYEVYTSILGCKSKSNIIQIKVNTIPDVNIISIININSNSVKLSVDVSSNGNITNYQKGICWSINPNPTILDNKKIIGSGAGNFIDEITGLTTFTKYYIRSFVSNDTCIKYSNEMNFITDPNNCGLIVYNGKIYKTVIIGSQCWLRSNLETTSYNNGETIQNVMDNNIWLKLKSGAYCDYNNDTSNSAIYGKLYNWYAATDNRKICPTGWHVPTDADWTTLTDYLGGSNNAGGRLKETGEEHWYTPNSGATNESGFYARPGGARTQFQSFYVKGYYGNWWISDLSPFYFVLHFNKSNADKGTDRNKNSGLSVRCIKD